MFAEACTLSKTSPIRTRLSNFFQTFCYLPSDEVLLVPSLTPKLVNHSLLFASDPFFSVYTSIHYIWRLHLLSPAERCTVLW